jgi:ABC-type multidrug transport system ATPase subunit
MQLEVVQLSKKYSDKVALKNVNFCLTQGIYGLLGANGAGKSTLIKLLTCNTKASCGEVLWNGRNVTSMKHKYMKQLGYVPQQQGMYPEMTAEQFLYYMAQLKAIGKTEAAAQVPQLLRQVHLYDVRNKRVGGFSGGMKQRVLIAQALLGNPSIVIFDEPTAGLDPKERIRIRNLISELAFDKIVLIATHVVTDIEFISKEILILDDGKLIRQGSPDRLLQELEHKVWEISVSEEEYARCKNKYLVSHLHKRDNRIILRCILPKEEIDASHAAFCQEVRPDLEDLYLHLFSEQEAEEEFYESGIC